MIIELGEWLPDVPPIDNPGMIFCENLSPLVKGMNKIRAENDVGSLPAGTGEIVGGFSANSMGTTEDYCGDNSDLFRLTWGGSSITTANASKSAAAYTVAAGDFWDFTQFGDKVIAVHGGASASDAPQIITIGNANFADLGGTPPKAKTCATLKDFVVFGHTHDATDGERSSRIRWCGIGDETSWPISAATQADFQDLDSSVGTVQRVCGGEDVIIVTSKGVVLMTYIGGSAVMRFDQIAPGRARGTPFPSSVIRDGSTVYFWSDSGPVAVSKDGSVKNIAEGKCAEYLRIRVTNNVQGVGKITPVAYRDPQYNAICWSIGGALGSLYYYPAFDQFSLVKEAPIRNYIWASRLVEVNSTNVEAPLFQPVDNGGTYDELDLWSRSSETETMPYDVKTGGRQLFPNRRALLKEARVLQGSYIANPTVTFSCATADSGSEIGILSDLQDGDYTALTENTTEGSIFQGLFEGRYHFFRITCTDSGSTRSTRVNGIELMDASPSGRY